MGGDSFDRWDIVNAFRVEIMIVKKQEVIKVYMAMIKRFLEKHLPEEDYECEMIDKSRQIIIRCAGHIKEV